MEHRNENQFIKNLKDKMNSRYDQFRESFVSKYKTLDNDEDDLNTDTSIFEHGTLGGSRNF